MPETNLPKQPRPSVIKIPPELATRLKVRAALEHTTMQALVAEAVINYIAQRQVEKAEEDGEFNNL